MRDEEDMSADDGEGLSTGKKVIAGAALGVAVPAAVGVARKLLSDDDDGESGGSRSSGRAGSRSRATGTSRARSSTSRARSTTSGARSTGTRKTASRAKSSGSTRSKSTTTRSKSSTTARSSGGGARPKTREQLYRQATRLKIDGRSNMTKAQLERAVARAKAK
jgi:hypothetical protein